MREAKFASLQPMPMVTSSTEPTGFDGMLRIPRIPSSHPTGLQNALRSHPPGLQEASCVDKANDPGLLTVSTPQSHPSQQELGLSQRPYIDDDIDALGGIESMADET